MAELNKIIHERARLLILTYLASSSQPEVSFNELLEQLEFTSGNLSVQLKKLQAVDYVEIHKTFKNNKPFTSIGITQKGTDALNEYVNEMEAIIGSMRQP